MHKGINTTLDEGQTPIVTIGGGFDAVAIQGTVIGRSEHAGPQGSGADDSGAMFTLTKTDVHAVAQPVPYDFYQITAPVNRQNRKPGDPRHTLARDNAAHATIVTEFQSLYDKGIRQGDEYASAQEADAGALLRVLQNSIGEEAFAQWGLGILDSLQSPEVLQQALHGLGVRPATFSRRWVVYCSLSCEKSRAEGVLQSLREAECERCSPQGWQPSQQCLDELGAYLSQLSQPGAQATRFMHDLWQDSKATGVLQQALLAIQNVGRPVSVQAQPAQPVMQVRRLTPQEAEFLQGFPRGYTNIPWRNKPESPDGPRYKALGNSMAVPVMRHIGERINEVSKL